MIDKQGRLFGVVNVVDALVILILVCALPAVMFGYKILSKPSPPPVIAAHYTLSRNCPICGEAKLIKVLKGNLPPKSIEDICLTCGNTSMFIKPPKIVPPDPDYTQMLNELLYKEKDKKHGQAK